MSFAASRAVLRRSTFALRRTGARNASSTSEAAGAAKEKTAQAQSKASEGLSKVQSSAGSALSRAGSMASGTLNSLANAGGRTGRLIGRIQSLIPPTIYYSRVALEMGKFVIRERKMSPPDVSAFQSYMEPLINAVRHPSSLLQRAPTSSGEQTNVLNQIRNMSRDQWTTAGIVAAEVVGFFSIGEMIGRWKIVGYRHTEEAHH